MRRPFISRSQVRSRRKTLRQWSGERGVTMALVAIAMIAILGMALLSIDEVTLYLSRDEAQRAADAAALAAARVLSLSGITGDPQNATSSWTPACNAATEVATAVAQQNTVGGLAVPTAQIVVSFPNNPGCGGDAVFGVNPQVTVKVTRQNLPTFFARAWGRASVTVSASATAEAYNPSNSASFAAIGLVPVQPRCVKPLIVPNSDPGNGANPFVNTSTGAVVNPGVSQLGSGVIGEQFSLTSACTPGHANCDAVSRRGGGVGITDNPPIATTSPAGLDYVPAETAAAPYTAVNSACSNGDDYEMAIDGCDQQTQYNCGTPTPNGATVNLNEAPVNPTVLGGETSTSLQCLINQSAGQDQLITTNGSTAVFPFQIQAGSGNPLVGGGSVATNDVITTSNSIVTLPIYDSTIGAFTRNRQPVTIVGFLQVFVNSVQGNGNPLVTVLNVAGCSNNATNSAVAGSSPVPVRLITPP